MPWEEALDKAEEEDLLEELARREKPETGSFYGQPEWEDGQASGSEDFG